MSAPHPIDILSGGDLKPKRRLSTKIAEAVFYAAWAGTGIWLGWQVVNLLLSRSA